MSEDYGQLKKGSKEYEEKRQEIKSEVLKKKLEKDDSPYTNEFAKFKNKNSGMYNENEAYDEFAKKKGFL